MSLQRRLIANAEEVDGCWRWSKYVRPDGYVIVQVREDGKAVAHYAHRLMYELLNGPIPEGYDVDHTCHDPAECAPGRECPHRRCINPMHLQAVTRRINTYRSGGVTAINKRKTHCKHGHEFSPENTAIRPCGGRTCRTCERDKVRRRRETRSAA